MDDRTTRFREKIASALAPPGEGSSSGADGHPDFDDLVRYRAGALPEADAEEVRSHLAACGECLESFLDLGTFVGAPDRHRPDVRDLETEIAWRGLKDRLPGRRRWPPLAMAASVTLALLAAGYWAVRERTAAADLRRQVARLSAPQPDAPIVDLFPESARRGAAVPAPVELPPGDGYLILVLSLPEPPEDGDFEAEIVDPRGSSIWTGKLEMSAFGTFRLGVRRDFLGAKKYTIRLYALAGGRRVPIADYPLRRSPAAGDSRTDPR